MKEFFFTLALMLAFTTTISAHPITITLSNGQTVILDSDLYPTMDDVLKKIDELESKIESEKIGPTTTK